MIISLRGTNGCGKSTIVRRVMEAFPSRSAVTVEGRQRPLGYVCTREVNGGRHVGGSLFVPGHYEIANGGVDTLRDLDEAYSLIIGHAREGHNVLYEGKNMSDGTRRIVHLRLELGLDVRVILVSYPLEDCVAAVRARGHSISTATIEKLYRKSFRDADVLDKCAVPVQILARDAALARVREWLHLR